MAKVEIKMGEIGGSVPEWITPTYNGDGSLTFDFNMSNPKTCILVFQLTGGYKGMYLIDVATENAYAATQDIYWYTVRTLSGGGSSGWGFTTSWTANSLTIGHSSGFVNGKNFLIPISDDSVLSYF